MGKFNITVVSKHTIKMPESSISIPDTASIVNVEASSFQDALKNSQNSLNEIETFAEQENSALVAPFERTFPVEHSYTVIAYGVEDECGNIRFFDLKYQRMPMHKFLSDYATIFQQS